MSDRAKDGKSLRFISLDPKKFEHGTVARYVAKCRCDHCRKALRDRARARAEEARTQAVSLKPNGPLGTRILIRAGVGYRVKTCPGTNGVPCVRGGAWLRKPFYRQLGICMACVERATVWNPNVSTKKAQRHLLAMRRKGIGYKTIADAAGVSRSLCQELVTGRALQIRLKTEHRILATDEGARTEGCVMPGAATRKKLQRILDRGFTQTWVSRQLGRGVYVFSKAAIAGMGRVRTATAVKVDKLWQRINAGKITPRPRWVSSAPVWKLVRELLDEGLTMRDLSRKLAYPLQAKTLELQRVRPATAEKVEKLHRQIFGNERRPQYDDQLSIDDFATARNGSGA